MKPLNASANALLLSLVVVGGMVLLPLSAHAQATPKTQLNCWYCAELYPGIYHCEQGFHAEWTGASCYAWIDEYGQSWCEVYGVCPSAQMEEVSAADLKSRYPQASALTNAAEATETQPSDHQGMWVRHECDGSEAAAYVQVAGDRFVPIAVDNSDRKP